METRVKVFIKANSTPIFTNLFGYTSKGMPGIEIVGMGTQGRFIKEKLIYFTKFWNLKCPPLKYVICLENNTLLNLKQQNFSYLELPVFLLFFKMARVLSMKNLEECLCLGKINSDGTIQSFSFTENQYRDWSKGGESQLKVIATMQEREKWPYILPLESILDFLPSKDISSIPFSK